MAPRLRAARHVALLRMGGSHSRWVSAFAALVWASWILYLGTDDRRRVIGFSGASSEAIQHIVAFAVLGALLMLTVRRRPWLVFGVTAAAGVIGEFAQLATPDRTFSATDMVFSVAGAAIGVAVVGPNGRVSVLAVMSIAALLIAFAPLALELSVVGVDTSFPDECSAPPAPVEGPPEIVLGAHFTPGGGDRFPISIDEPTSAVLREQLIATDEFSLAVEFSTTALDQEGPARLLTISNGAGTHQVNLHLGVERDGISVRLRTSCDIFNSIVVPDVVTSGVRHRVVVTWGAGSLDVWIDAARVESAALPWGDLDRWDPTYPITVGDEVGGGRRFEGSVYAVTMWDRRLDDDAVVDATAN